MEWRRICDDLGKPTKDRLQALETLLDFLNNNSLDVRQKGELVDLSTDLLSDNNRKVAQLTLEALAKVILQNPDGLKTYLKFLVHHAADKLADTNQLVRQSACNVLLALAATFSADAVREKIARYFSHKSWRARHGVVQLFAETAERHGFERTEANINFVETALRLLEDPDNTVRDATAEFLQEVYKLWGEPLWAQCTNSLRPAQLAILYTKLEQAGLVAPDESNASASVAGDSSVFDENDTVMLSNMLIKGQHSMVGRGQEDYRGASDQLPPNSRRGGYKDGGGLAANGTLPDAEPIPVQSERELREEMEPLADRLAITVQWDQRVDAMVRLEGLARGAGAFQDHFVELLKPLKDVLTQQVNDRRSAVSRQACHLLGALAVTLVDQFEPFAVHFFPVLIRVSIITVQVIAESAELCIRVILQHCESTRLPALIADTLQKEKNVKIRTLCSLCLLRVLELWHPESYLRCIDAIEAALAKALQDKAPETRRNARDAYGAYSQTCPEQAAAFYKRVNRDLQDKMDDATRAYIMGERLSSGSWSSQSSLGGSRAGPGSIAGASTSSKASSFGRAGSSAAGDVPPLARGPSRTGSSLGPDRSSTSGRDAGYFRRPSVVPNDASDSVDSLVLTGSVTSSAMKGNGTIKKARMQTSRLGREDAPTPRMQASRVALNSQASSRGYSEQPTPSGQAPPALSREASREYADYGAQPKPVSVSKVVNTLLAEGKSWSEKVDALAGLRDVLKGSLYGDPGELARELERAQVKLLECVEDAHFRVVQAGLEALAAALNTAPRLFEPSLDRIMPTLFLKMIDAKEVIRTAAKETLEVCAVKCSADAIMPGLVRAVETMRVPKSRVAVLEFAVASIGTQSSAGSPVTSMHLKQWVSKLIPMLSDKSGEVRRIVVQALQSVYTNVDSHVVLNALANASGANALAMKRALLPVAPDIEAQAHGSPSPHRVSSSGADLQIHIAASRRSPSAPDTKPSAPPSSSSVTLSDSAASLQGDRPTTPARAASQVHPPEAYPHSASAAASHPLPDRSKHSGSSSGMEPPSTSESDQRGLLSTPATSTNTRHQSHPPATSYTTPQPRQHRGAAVATPIYPKTPLGTTALPMTPEDPSVQAMHIKRLLRDVSTSSSDQALGELVDCIRSVPDSVWDGRMDKDGSYVQAVLHTVAPLAADSKDECRERAARVLRDMARHHPSLLQPHLEPFISALLTFSCDSSPEVLMTANEGLDAIAQSAPAQACLDCLLNSLPSQASASSSDANPLTAVIKSMQKVIQRLPPAELTARLQPKMLPRLFQAINHDRTEVRKAAVFCLVEMWAQLGEALSPELEALNMTQRKLLTFYFTRRQEQVGPGGH